LRINYKKKRKKKKEKEKEERQFIQRIKILYNSAKCLEFIGVKNVLDLERTPRYMKLLSQT
jgi:hypothetical protein